MGGGCNSKALRLKQSSLDFFLTQGKSGSCLFVSIIIAHLQLVHTGAFMRVNDLSSVFSLFCPQNYDCLIQ